MNEKNPPEAIDFLSLENDDTVLLHLLVNGSWEPYDGVMEWLIQKLDNYVHFVVSGQMAEDTRYRGRAATIIVHSERFPPELAMHTLARVRKAVDAYAISLRLTVGDQAHQAVQLPDAE